MTGGLIERTEVFGRIGEVTFVKQGIACNFGSKVGAVLASCSWGYVLGAVASGGYRSEVSGCFGCPGSGIEACSAQWLLTVAGSGLGAIPHIASGATTGT